MPIFGVLGVEDISGEWPSGHMGQIFLLELMIDIYSKSLVRAIGKVLLMKFS